jgi:hypothetical protein
MDTYVEAAAFLHHNCTREQAKRIVHAALYNADLPVELECRISWFFASQYHFERSA